MSNNKIVNISNPVPILQQQRSNIVTNPFIPNDQKTIEIQEIDKQANKIIEEQYNKNKTSSIFNQSLDDLNKNISTSFIGFFDDLFIKPDEVSWYVYIQIILQKNSRYTYIGIILVLIAIYMLIVKTN